MLRLYATPNEERDFAQKISLLMDDPDLRVRMGQIGRQRIETQLSWSHQKQNLRQAYAAIGFPGTRVESPYRAQELKESAKAECSPMN